MPDTTPRQAWASCHQDKNNASRYFSPCWCYKWMISSGATCSKHLVIARNQENTNVDKCLHSMWCGVHVSMTSQNIYIERKNSISSEAFFTGVAVLWLNSYSSQQEIQSSLEHKQQVDSLPSCDYIRLVYFKLTTHIPNIQHSLFVSRWREGRLFSCTQNFPSLQPLSSSICQFQRFAKDKI